MLLPLSQCSDAIRKVGARGAQLVWLHRHHFALPPTWILRAKAFHDMVEASLPPAHDPHSLLRLHRAPVRTERVARAHARVLRTAVDPILQGALRMLWHKLRNSAPWGLAIRASATCEDTTISAMAGLSLTLLGVDGTDALIDAVRQVWSQVFLPSVYDYLIPQGVRDVAMAVVIQPVVMAQSTGMLFPEFPPTWGAHTALWHPGERLICAVPGLGAPLAQNPLWEDSFQIAHDGTLIDALVVRKPTRLEVTAQGVQPISIEPSQTDHPALEPEALRQLSEIATQLEASAWPAPAVTFAFSGDELRLLDAHTTKGRGYPEGGAADTAWSRVMMGEMGVDALFPLTRSLAQPLLERGLRKALTSLGCPVPKAEPLITCVQGRPYFNLTALSHASQQIPGFGASTLAELCGAGGSYMVARHVASSSSHRRFYARLPQTITRMFRGQTRLTTEVEHFESTLHDVQGVFSELDLAILPDDALVQTLRDAHTLLERSSGLHIRAALDLLASHLGLQGLLRRASIGTASQLAQSFVTGVPELETLKPILAIARVASSSRQDTTGLEHLVRHRVRSPMDLPEGALRRSLAQLLEDHGDHGLNAVELQSPRWREDPSLVLAMVAAAAHAQAYDPDKSLARARAVADRERAMLEQRLSFLELKAAHALSERARRFLRLRERMRTSLTRILAMVRQIVLEVDRRLIRVDLSLEPGAAFFCTHDELTAALATGRPDLGHIVRVRRWEHARGQSRREGSVFFVGTPPPPFMIPRGEAILRGTPASGGVVTGRVRVITSEPVNDGPLEPGEILVTRSADTGFTPFLLSAAGMVSELGGPLCSASVLAREFGLPSAVYVTGALNRLRTGDLIRLDGNSGIVECLETRRAS